MKKSNKKILFVDMDGVVADFWRAIQCKEPNIDNKDYFPTTEDQEVMVDEICAKNPNIFRNLQPIFGAVSAVKKLSKYYDVYFLSTPMWEVPQSYTDKRLWLEKHFGDMAYKKLILTHRKDLCVGNVLIDDRLKNGSETFKGFHLHFGTREFSNWDKTTTFLLNNINIL